MLSFNFFHFCFHWLLECCNCQSILAKTYNLIDCLTNGPCSKMPFHSDIPLPTSLFTLLACTIPQWHFSIPCHFFCTLACALPATKVLHFPLVIFQWLPPLRITPKNPISLVLCTQSGSTSSFNYGDNFLELDSHFIHQSQNYNSVEISNFREWKTN